MINREKDLEKAVKHNYEESFIFKNKDRIYYDEENAKYYFMQKNPNYDPKAEEIESDVIVVDEDRNLEELLKRVE